MGKKKDFTAAHRVKVPPLQTIMGHLFPKRTENEASAMNTFDVTELMKYIEKKNAEHPEYKTTVFHCVVFAVARIIKERPFLNRYIQAGRFYERESISLSFVVKREFKDGAKESLFLLVPKEDDTIDSVSRRIVGEVKEVRKKDYGSSGGVDQNLNVVSKFPGPLLALFVGTVRELDYMGIDFKALKEGDPNFTTVLLSNLGSIQAPACYHHLNNYGTNSIMITVGTLRDEVILKPDGSTGTRTMLDICTTIDERIADGFYFAKSLRLLKHIFEHPEILELPFGEPSGFDYENKKV